MKSDFKIDSSISPMVQLLICMLWGVLTLFSCIGEIEQPSTGTVQEEDRVVHLRIWFPSNPTGSQSRSITGTEENSISSLYILSFRMDGNAEKFDYWSEGSEKEGNANGSSLQDYSAVLKIRNHPQRLVLLANIGEEVKKLIEHGNWSGVEKEVMLAFLDENAGDPENKWNADSPLDYRSLPMWGESVPETILNTTFQLTETIPLLRMVAKIDVQVDESVSGLTEKFRLWSVRLYNTNTKGRLVPARENTEDVTVGGNRTVSVKKPTIPMDIADYNERHPGPVVYEDFSSPGKEDIAMRNAIYLFEAASTAIPAEATCLVLGGCYGTDTQESYYRVDFVADDGVILRDILRNHRYMVNIMDVKQRGHTAPDDAFHSKGENIKVSILVWDEADMDDIWFDGQYYYSVSPRKAEYDGKACNGNQIKVKTDYPVWSYELSDRSQPDDPLADPARVNWLTITTHQTGTTYPGEGVAAYIGYDLSENSQNELRTAYIHITAGRMTMTVMVDQTPWNIGPFVVNPIGDIPAAGQTRKVKAGGTFGTIQIRARETTGDVVLSEGTIVGGVNDNSTDLTIPAFTPLSNKLEVRQVAIEYYDSYTGRWELIRTDFQRSIYFFITTDYNPGQTMPGIGYRYTARVEGEFPTIFLRSAIDNTVLREGTFLLAGSGTSAAPVAALINVPTNGTGQERRIDLQYSLDQSNWITISSGIQQADHYVLAETGRIVAKNNLPVLLSWMEAMGIDYATYRLNYFYSTYGDDQTNLNYTPDEGIETGCAGYYESADAHDKGAWRLATLAELQEIEKAWREIGGFDTGKRFWCSYEQNWRYGINYSIPGGMLVTSYEKTTLLYVRCVMNSDYQK